MITDIREHSGKTLECDICIIGAGPSGLALARHFVGSDTRVIILESGGLEFERASQKLARGVSAGIPYEGLDLCRVRRFGGSTGRRGWGGWCKPLSEIDFAPRSWVPMSGWPITLDELQPYYNAALKTLELPFSNIQPDNPSPPGLPFEGTPLEIEQTQLTSSTELPVGLLQGVKSAPNILVLLHATATWIETDVDGRRATAVRAVSLGGHRCRIVASWTVLAAGGIENARLLLQSNDVKSSGLGNDHDMVGRCFMDHPRFAWGHLSSPNLVSTFRQFDPASVVRGRNTGMQSLRHPVGLGLVLNPQVQRDEMILNARTWLMRVPASGEGVGGRGLKELIFWLKKARVTGASLGYVRGILSDLPNAISTAVSHVGPPRHWHFVTVMEQEPSLSSRVRLDHSRDALGQQSVRLEWHLGPLVDRTLRRNQYHIIRTLTSLGVKASAVHATRMGEPEVIRWTWHNMGTTRMSIDPNEGVVDPTCRVHGIDNLFVAGSSVFPTGGNDMPTLTIIALAHRLGAYLSDRLRRANTPPEILPRPSQYTPRRLKRQQSSAEKSVGLLHSVILPRNGVLP